MNGDDFLDLVMSRLGNRTEAALRAICLTEVNRMVSTELERHPVLPYFLLQDDSVTFQTAASTETVSLTGFLGFDEDWGQIYVYDSSSTDPDKWVRLTRRRFQELRLLDGANAEAIPEGYDLQGTTLYLRPIPDDAYNLRVIGYFADDPIADSAATTLWLTHANDLLLAMVVHKVAQTHLKDYELAQIVQGDIAAARGRLTLLQARMESQDKDLEMRGE